MRFLFVFGAGASAAEGAPVIGNFLAEAFRACGNTSEFPEFAIVWEFLRESFGKPITSAAQLVRGFPALDEVLSLIDYALLTNTSLTAQHSPDALLNVKKGVVALIAKTLQLTTKSYDNHIAFLKRQIGSNGGCDIISLNYDTILDKALKSIVGADRIDYCFAPSSPKRMKDHYRLLKIHGSLNWASCTLCNSINIFDDNVAHQLKGSHKCSRCSYTQLEPVIITPTLLKEYRYTWLYNVWDYAFLLISNCDALVFIGYSLNPADIAIIHLFKRALSSNKKPRKIVVIDKYDSLSTEQSPVKVRYTKIFSNQILYVREGFHGYLDMEKVLPQQS